jgi:hypothetical protein
MFTIFVILFIIIELFYVINLKGMTDSVLNLIKANKEFKGSKWNQFPEEYKNNIINGCFKALIMMVVLFGGLLTDQWVLWLSILSINLFLVGPLNKFFRKTEMMIGYYIVTWINSVIGLGAGVFHVINDYHLHIDLFEFVKNFFA